MDISGTGLTSFLHEGEEVVQEVLPLGVAVQLVKLKEKRSSGSGSGLG